jgi:hypothetical protein
MALCTALKATVSKGSMVLAADMISIATKAGYFGIGYRDGGVGLLKLIVKSRAHQPHREYNRILQLIKSNGR